MTRAIARAVVVAAFALGAVGCGGPGSDSGGPFTPGADAGFGTCVPDCHFKQCGSDGCGGICGYCSSPYACDNFQCALPTGGADAGGPGGVDAGSAEPDIPKPSGTDGDGDGVDDNLDNCPTVYNPNQSDLDEDYVGDTCDPDMDDDGTINDLDCKPTDPRVHPDAREMCHNAVDDDCDGQTDEENAWDCTDFYVDNDGDGAGDSADSRCLCAKAAPHLVKVAGDCDDASPGYSPLVAESCDNIDNNCNLLVDEGCDDDGDGFCDAAMTIFGTPAVCPGGGGDCYDYSPDVFPGAPEIEGDDIDNDCDGVKAGEPVGGPIDCSCPSACYTTSPTTDDFLCALDMCCTNLVINKKISSPTNDAVGGAWGTLTHFGSLSNDLAPFKGGSYAFLSSGAINGVGYPQGGNSLPGAGSAYDPYGSEAFSEMYDAVAFQVTMKVPDGATGFSIDYIFMSAEYEEFIGTEWNDKFYIVLTSGSTNGGAPTVVNYTACSNPSAYYDTIVDGNAVCYIAINTAFSEPCSNPQTDISGTGMQCPQGSSSGWLTTKWPVISGETIGLTFHIHDTSDQIYDSTVLLDNFQWEGGAFDKGTSSHN